MLLACRRGVVALGLGTKLVANTAFVVLTDPSPPTGIRSIGFSMPAEGWGGGQQVRGGGRGERGGRKPPRGASSMSIFRIHMGKKLCRQLACTSHVCLLRDKTGAKTWESSSPQPKGADSAHSADSAAHSGDIQMEGAERAGDAGPQSGALGSIITHQEQVSACRRWSVRPSVVTWLVVTPVLPRQRSLLAEPLAALARICPRVEVRAATCSTGWAVFPSARVAMTAAEQLQHEVG